MPRAHFVVESQTPITTRGRQVCGMFDAPPEEKQRLEWDIALPLEDRPWQVGLIHGPSGSGKSTVARALFGGETKVEWRAKTALIDNFPAAMSVEQIATLCSAVGLNTIPCWLRPHEVLSNGERFRADMARLLAEAAPGSTVVVDEFTSVVDRQVAQVASHALQKAVRKAGFRLVAVSCHSHIIEWLQPDCTLELGERHIDLGLLRQRPPIQRSIARVPPLRGGRLNSSHLSASLAMLLVVALEPQGARRGARPGCWRTARRPAARTKTGGPAQNRTGVDGFAIRCLTTWLRDRVGRAR